jgi:hypothetical protein
MKKLIMLLFVAFVAFAATSQTVGTAVAFAKDSTTDTQIKYMAVANAVAIQGNYTAGLTLVPTNKSGTATVTAALQFSNNGSVWHDYGSSTTINNAGTPVNFSWVLSDLPFKYVRLKCSSSGTGVTILNGALILKKK